MVNLRTLSSLAVLAALVSVASCQSGAEATRTASLPNGVIRPNDHANRLVSSRGRHYITQLRAPRDRTVEENIDDAAGHGARVFRVPVYVVWDPSAHSTYTTPKSSIHETPHGIVLDTATGPKALSRDATVSRKPQYTYLFVRGSASDPNPATGAIRVR